MTQLKLSFTTFLELHEYPAVRVGGIYAILLGVVVMLAARFDEGGLAVPILLGGTLLVSVAILFNRPLRKYLAFGHLPDTQKQMTKVVFVCECLIVTGVLVFFSGADPRMLIAILMLVLATAQLTLTYVYGPWMLFLGLLCMINAMAAIWLHDVPFAVVGVLDGILKLGLGFLMLSSFW